MWFVFPQLAGLGRSETSRFFGIGSAGEARAYLAHPLLGPRLRESIEAALTHRERGAGRIFGAIDAVKLRSSLTLFEAVADDPTPFATALNALCGGERDAETLRRLGRL